MDTVSELDGQKPRLSETNPITSNILRRKQVPTLQRIAWKNSVQPGTNYAIIMNGAKVI